MLQHTTGLVSSRFVSYLFFHAYISRNVTMIRIAPKVCLDPARIHIFVVCWRSYSCSLYTSPIRYESCRRREMSTVPSSVQCRPTSHRTLDLWKDLYQENDYVYVDLVISSTPILDIEVGVAGTQTSTRHDSRHANVTRTTKSAFSKSTQSACSRSIFVQL